MTDTPSRYAENFAFTRRHVLSGAAAISLPFVVTGLRLSVPNAQAQSTTFAAELRALEERAQGAGVELSRKTGADAETYDDIMPRLVDMIENKKGDENLAESAAELLSRVNAAERSVMPDDDMKAPPQFEGMETAYRSTYATCEVRPDRKDKVGDNVSFLMRHRDRYEKVATALNIPWYFIGIIHGLEASFNFRGHLHNGDYPLTKRTVHVPAGRPLVWNPPTDWETSAADALQMKGFDKEIDWSVPRLLYRWERYNGFGYHWRNAPSPYLWSFSNQYSKGKYVSDGRWDPNYVSQQCGAAPMLKTLVASGVVPEPA